MHDKNEFYCKKSLLILLDTYIRIKKKALSKMNTNAIRKILIKCFSQFSYKDAVKMIFTVDTARKEILSVIR